MKLTLVTSDFVTAANVRQSDYLVSRHDGAINGVISILIARQAGSQVLIKGRCDGRRFSVGFGSTDVIEIVKRGTVTECGEIMTDTAADGTVNGHYHYQSGACDNEPTYAMGGPA